MPLTRRAMLGLLSSSTFFLTASATTLANVTVRGSGASATFPQGVASGDPQPDAVMLWTRAVPADNSPSLSLVLQLSSDAGFAKLLLQEPVVATIDSDYTIRAYVDGLQPDRHYYYRFVGAGDSISREGRTRTAPSPDQAADVNMAFASCQSYEQAYYGAWARMLADDAAAPADKQIQFVLHLGDFIYERSWSRRPDGSANSRSVPPFPDGVQETDKRYAVSLADYRHLYKTYLSDPHLQAARARWPFLCVWDDHEFSNDNFQGYSTYTERPKADAARKLASNQAWFEFIPAILSERQDQPASDFRANTLGIDEAKDNRNAVASLCIYRSLRWGRHLDIVLTDNRSYRSPPCVPDTLAGELDLPMNPANLVEIADAGSAYNDGNPPQFLPYGDGTVANPGRDRPPGTCLGETQRDWFLNRLQSSGANWKLWGNALPLIPLRVDLASIPFSDYEDSVLLIDSWAGFPHEQRALMQAVEADNITGLVSLSGDHHMHGAGTVSQRNGDPGAKPVAVDFSCTGIASTPMYDDLLEIARNGYPEFQPLVYREKEGHLDPVWNMTMLDGVQSSFAFAKTGLQSLSRWLGPNQANTGLKYVDTRANGYGLAQFKAEELRVQLITMDDVHSPVIEPPRRQYQAKFQLPLWRAGAEPQLQGPEFEGGAPFPFDTPTV